MVKLLEEIKNSFEILKLEENWEEEGALKPDLKIFNKAMLFIHSLASKVENLSVPEINLCRDASIDFSFRNKEYRLLVNIDSKEISCYGDDGNRNHIIKTKTSSIEIDNIIEWCQKYMSE